MKSVLVSLNCFNNNLWSKFFLVFQAREEEAREEEKRREEEERIQREEAERFNKKMEGKRKRRNRRATRYRIPSLFARVASREYPVDN